jgi:starch phosphorylase
LKNKEALASYILEYYGIKVDPCSIFDVQIKRLHAYKRQLLNGLHILYLYLLLQENPNLDFYPQTFIFGAKAAPGYYLAKCIIKLIHDIARMVNEDPRVNEKIKVIFLENYRVSLAEKIIPAADVSEQISTAGKEASGTGNMKLMMNGAITIGTMDGANVEIHEAVGSDNMFVFGMSSAEVMNYEMFGGYNAWDMYHHDPRIKKVMDFLIDYGSSKRQIEYESIYHNLLVDNDEYFVLKDFSSYVAAQEKVNNAFRDRSRWMEMSIRNIAESGIFSSDRTISQYAREIWGIHAQPIL